METPEKQWIADAASGDDRAFSLLVHEYTRPIYNFAYRLTGNVQTAEDITQETFVKVWKSLKRYDPRHPFRAWIFTIARNTSTDYLRKKSSIPFSNLDYDDFSYQDSIKDDTERIEKSLERIDDAKTLETLLEKIPPDYKTVLVLYYQNDMTFEEIGTVLKKSVNTVKSQHRRALIKLRELMRSGTDLNLNSV